MYLRRSDYVGIVFPVVCGVMLCIFLEKFIGLTRHYPYLSGFGKVAILATYGEYLKNRRISGSWKITYPILRFVVWGIFGWWFTYAFSLFRLGVEAVAGAGLWPNFGTVWMAFSQSLAINFLGGYAFTMMLVHEYWNKSIERGRPLLFSEFAKTMQSAAQTHIWFSYIPKSIFLFWLPAHTVTFLLPAEFQVFFAAVLSVVLGFILTIKH